MTYIDDAYPEELDDAYKEPQHFPMTQTDILSVREQIQSDLICLLESHFGEVDGLFEVQDLACQIVVDNFTQLL